MNFYVFYINLCLKTFTGASKGAPREPHGSPTGAPRDPSLGGEPLPACEVSARGVLLVPFGLFLKLFQILDFVFFFAWAYLNLRDDANAPTPWGGAPGG